MGSFLKRLRELGFEGGFTIAGVDDVENFVAGT
jgi:hypothetical protein